MKYLKYILGLIGLLVIAFFLMGIIKPEVAYDSEITVDKSTDEAWAVVQDEAKMAEWLTGFQKMEHLSGTPGTVGAKSLVHFNNDGQEMSITETITEIVPQESISMTFVDDFMTMDYTMSLTSVDGKTKINSKTIAVGTGAISKSMMALMGGALKEQEDTNLTSLKKAIEQNTKDYFPTVQESADNNKSVE